MARKEEKKRWVISLSKPIPHIEEVDLALITVWGNLRKVVRQQYVFHTQGLT